MTWAVLIPLIVQYGIPTAVHIAEKWQNKDQPVTPEELKELKYLAAQTPRTQMIDALNRAGIPLDSEKGKEMLALVGGV